MPSLPQPLLLALARIVGPDALIDDQGALLTYEADGCQMDLHAPQVVVLPTATEQVAAIVRLAVEHGVPIVPRGAGTGLTGGSTPSSGGIVIGTARMDRILELDLPNCRVRVQPGVINYELSQHLRPHGYHFAPDPSSQRACTVGGNIANNSGGPHCLKYGATTSHVLGVQVVLPDGRVLWTGDGTPGPGQIAGAGHVAGAGYDLTGVLCGSEGTLGVVTQAWLRVMKLPEAQRVILALFSDIASASRAVSAVIRAGLLPAALEMMDALAIRAVNDMYRLGLPPSAGAALLIELDGVLDGIDDILGEVVALCQADGALEVRPARTPAEQERVWAARKNAFGAMGRLAPSYYLVDTVVPRTRLPYTLAQVGEISRDIGLPIANVFHAGDGNLHPIILFDRRKRDEARRALEGAERILAVSVEQGGVPSGEHGIGIEKRDALNLIFTVADLAAMAGLHGCFNPLGLCNPGKIFPRNRGCGELLALRRSGSPLLRTTGSGG